MKLFAIICTLLLTYQVQATVGNVLDDLVKQVLEVVRKHMVARDPLPVLPIRPLIFKDSAIKTDIALHLSQITLSKAGNFVVNKISNNLVSLHSEFGMSFPTIQLQGDFDVTGFILGLEVTGRGKFTVDITNLVVNGEFQMETGSGGTLQVKSNSVSYTVQDAKVTQTGLNVEGMTDQQVHDFLNNTMIKLLQINELGISEKIAEQAMNFANELVKGKTLNDVIADLKKIIDNAANII